MKCGIFFIIMVFSLLGQPALPDTPKYHIEISISKCRLYLYVQDDFSKTIIHEYVVATPKVNLKPYPFGKGTVTRIEFNPAWYPTEYSRFYFMHKLGIDLPAHVPPGDPLNFMGAFKIHLSHRTSKGDIYRIHGTNHPELVGTRATGGCIRMYNEEGVEMARMVPVGTEVNITD